MHILRFNLPMNLGAKPAAVKPRSVARAAKSGPAGSQPTGPHHNSSASSLDTVGLSGVKQISRNNCALG